MSWFAVALAAAVSIGAVPPAQAARKHTTAAANKKVVAVFFLLTDGQPNAKTLAAFGREIAKLAASYAGYQFVSPKQLRRALGRAPSAAATACGKDIACVARLGKRAGAREVLVARAAPSRTGRQAVSVKLTVVDARAEAVKGTVEIVLPSAPEAGRLLASRAASLFGTEAPGQTTVASAGASTEDIPLELPIGDVLGSSPSSNEARDSPPPSPEAAALLAAIPVDAEAAPAASSETRPRDGAADASEELPLDLENIPGRTASVVSSAPVSSPVSRSPVIRYAGFGSAGVGLLALALGGYFGSHADSLRGDIKYGPGGTDQLEADRLGTTANAETRRANIFFIVGGAAAVVGAGLLGLDLWVLPRGAPALNVSATPGRASAELQWSW